MAIKNPEVSISHKTREPHSVPPTPTPWRKIGLGAVTLAVLVGMAWGGSSLFSGKAENNDAPIQQEFNKDGIPKDSPAQVAAAQPKTYTETAFGLNAKMVYVPAGTFTMGCTSEQGSDCSSDEKPAHNVTLSGYYIGSTEVTQRQWRAVMGDNPSHFKGCDDCPVENVSWDDCQKFLKKLNAQTGLDYHLPTEAQWEYAARGGSGSGKAKFSGGSSLGAVGWYWDNAGSKTHVVGGKSANELGLYDMSGNVWEWCSDWYEAEYYKNSPQYNPTGTRAGQYRVLRGGSWLSSSVFCRVSLRNFYVPDFRFFDFGFRVTRD